MKKSIILAIAIISLLAAGCAQTAYKAQLSDAKDGNTVTISGFAFNPAEIKVNAGTAVTWINEDSAPHTVKFDAIESDKMGKGGKYEYTFMEPGDYPYICGIHPSMKGKVVVQ